MGFITKSYLQKQFENLAARISSVFAKKTDIPKNMTGASTSAAGKAGLAPAPEAGAATRYLRSDGTWNVPPDTNTTYSVATQSANGLISASDKKKLDGIATGAEVNVQPDWNVTDTSSDAFIKNKPTIPAAVAVKGDSETNYRTGNVNLTKANIGLGNVPNVATNDQTPTFTQASTRANLTSGEKLSISLGKIMKFFADLKNVAFSGSYSDLSNKPSTVTTSADGFMSSKDKSKLDGIANGANAYTHPTNSGNKHIPSGGSSGQILRWSDDGTAVWGDDKDTTYANMSAATTSAAGKAGLAPAPPAGAQGKYLRGDGTWQIPTNTTYSNFVKSGSGAKAGLVPAPSTTAGSTKYLREDGTWSIPPDTNTTYTNESLGQGYGTCSTAAATAAKVVSLSGYALVVGGYVSVKFTYDVPANATLNINNRGAKAVYYKGAAIKAGTIKAGDVATFVYVNSQYHLVNIDKQIDTRLSVESGKVYIEYEQ